MPIPVPRKSEKRSEFIQRCASDSVMNKEYPDNKKKIAICYSRWEDRRKTAKAIITVDDDEIAIFEEGE